MNDRATRSPGSRAPLAGVLVSAAFWVALLFAATLYGTVSLAPKLVAFDDLAERHHTRQWELVALERRLGSLKKTVSAIETDPRMAREQARMEFGTGDPDEQSIPVDGDLALEMRGSATTDGTTTSIPARRAPWYIAPLRVVASNRSLENTLLALAAGLAIYAFTFLRESAEETPPVRWNSSPGLP
jgi:cell division protein FtsB